jgi:hypothetical protein
MSDLFPVNGATFWIGTAAMSVPTSDVTLSTFSAVTWTQVADWQNMGAIGDAANEIATDLISRGRTVVQKGTRRSPAMQNNFAVNSSDAGQIAMIAAEAGNYNWPFKIVFNDSPVVATATVTVTIASPGVFSWTAHGLAIGDKVKFTTTGALPTGITANTDYFVKTVPSADTFTVSATSGGSVINTTGTQSGVHTGITVPTPTEKYFIGLVTQAQEQGGGANTTRILATTVAPNTNIVTVAPTP